MGANVHSVPRKIWQTLGAIKTGVILLILVVVLSAAGTVILQRPATEPKKCSAPIRHKCCACSTR